LISGQDKKKVGNQLWAQRIYEHAWQSREQSRVPADETFVTNEILKAKMEEFFGADLDDDLFESKQTKSRNTKESVPWSPLACEPEVIFLNSKFKPNTRVISVLQSQWFHGEQSNRNTDCDANSDHSTTSIKHYQAHHLFYSSKFAEAAKIYSELLNLVPPTNLQMRREITDGLTRSYLKAKKYSEALTASQELVSDINIFPAIITYQF
jgi:hypothetical protein